MIQTVNFNTFHDSFQAIRPDNFNYSGLRALFDYFEDLEEGIGESIELDVIATCCEMTQYGTIEECLQAYSLDDEEELKDNTTVIYCADGSIIIQGF